jgi:hypothetical protein
MLELRKLATVLSGVTMKESADGRGRLMRLSNLSDIKIGRIPQLLQGDVPEVARAQSIQDGDLIVAARGAATDVCTACESVLGAFVSLDLYLVRPNLGKIDPHYLYAFLTLPATQATFATGKQGSSLARLPKDALETLKVPVPAMDLQRKIAGLAGSFEQESKLLKKLSDLNSTLGREVVARAFAAADEKNSIRRKK